MQSIINTGLQTTDSKLYFLCVDTREKLEIQFVPAFISLDRDPGISPIKIVGRNTPKYQYSGGETTLNLDLDFCADETSRSSVIRKCNWLMSLTYNDRGKRPPKRVALIFGSLFNKEVWVVKKVTPRLSNFDQQRGFLPTQAYVSITLGLDVDYNLGWDDINAAYAVGTPDGSNPVDAGEARRDDNNDQWRDVYNDNSFEAIARRALQRLGLIQSARNDYF